MLEIAFRGGRMQRNFGRKAGLRLEELVSEELDRLNVQHRRTEHWGEEDTGQQIDLVVEPAQFSGLPKFEFQLTLRHGVLRKIRAFTLAALTSTTRGIRVYLEVLASKRTDVRDIARRVAYAIRDITRFRAFEDHNLLGIRLKIGRAVRGQKLERFSLMHLVGDWVMEKIKEQRALARAQRAKQRQHMQERTQARKTWQLFPSQKRPSPVCRIVPPAQYWHEYTMPIHAYVPIRQP